MPLKPATEILLSAAFVLTPEENWTQRAGARNEYGDQVSIRDPSACRWCLSGALRAAADSEPGKEFDRAENYLWGVLPAHNCITYFNDTESHAEVLAALYKAAELSEQS